MNIRSRKVEKLVTTLTKMTGESKTEAITKALQERHSSYKTHIDDKRLSMSYLKLQHIALLCQFSTDRTADEIIGYDERGLPT